MNSFWPGIKPILILIFLNLAGYAKAQSYVLKFLYPMFLNDIDPQVLSQQQIQQIRTIPEGNCNTPSLLWSLSEVANYNSNGQMVAYSRKEKNVAYHKLLFYNERGSLDSTLLSGPELQGKEFFKYRSDGKLLYSELLINENQQISQKDVKRNEYDESGRLSKITKVYWYRNKDSLSLLSIAINKMIFQGADTLPQQKHYFNMYSFDDTATVQMPQSISTCTIIGDEEIWVEVDPANEKRDLNDTLYITKTKWDSGIWLYREKREIQTGTITQSRNFLSNEGDKLIRREIFEYKVDRDRYDDLTFDPEWTCGVWTYHYDSIGMPIKYEYREKIVNEAVPEDKWAQLVEETKSTPVCFTFRFEYE
jgi:hypothetical protein